MFPTVSWAEVTGSSIVIDSTGRNIAVPILDRACCGTDEGNGDMPGAGVVKPPLGVAETGVTPSATCCVFNVGAMIASSFWCNRDTKDNPADIKGSLDKDNK